MHPIVLLRRLTLETESYASTMTTVAIRLRQAIEALIEQRQALIGQRTAAQPQPHSTTADEPSAASTLADSLHDALFCIDQLPEEACPVVLLVTDGTIAAPDMTRYDNAVMHMTARDISCSIISVHDPRATPPMDRYLFGVVPDFASLNFLCISTGGNMTHATPEDLEATEEFLLATDEELAVRVKRNTRLLKGELRKRVQTLRFGIFVRCASVDGTRWRRNYQLLPSRIASMDAVRPSARHKLGRSYLATLPRRATVDDWRWDQMKESRHPLQSLASLLQLRFNEGFTVSRCELTITPAAPTDIEAVCEWELHMQLQTVWEPLQTGIEWNAQASGRVEQSLSGGWDALPEPVQRLWLLNCILSIQYDEPGWISALEIPFEAGITKVDGQQVPVNLLGPDPARPDEMDMAVGYRLWREASSSMEKAQTQRNVPLLGGRFSAHMRVPQAVLDFVKHMAAEEIGVDSRIEWLCSSARMCTKALANQLIPRAWNEADSSKSAQEPDRLIRELHELGHTTARSCFDAANLEFVFFPKRRVADDAALPAPKKLATDSSSAKLARRETFTMIKTLGELLHTTCAHWCDFEGGGEGQDRGVDLRFEDFAPVHPDRYRASLGRSFLKVLGPEDWDANEDAGGDDYDHDGQDDAGKAGSTRQPSLCFVHYAWFPSTHSFTVFLRFFRVPVHGTRATLSHFFIESLLQRAQSLRLNFDVAVAPKAMRNLYLVQPNAGDPVSPNGVPLFNVLWQQAKLKNGWRDTAAAEEVSDTQLGPALLSSKNQRPALDSTLRSYLCKVTWVWTFPPAQGSVVRFQPSIYVEKCVRALLGEWRRLGFRDTLNADTVLTKEVLCNKHDPLGIHRGSHLSKPISNWQRWQHWYTEGKVRSVIQYAAETCKDGDANAIKVDLWIDPLSIQRELFEMISCYRVTVHKGEQRNPRLHRFYDWQSSFSHDMETGGTKAVFEQIESVDEGALSRRYSFDRMTQLCNTPEVSRNTPRRRASNDCAVCGRAEKRIIYISNGMILCSGCSGKFRLDAEVPPDLLRHRSHTDDSSKLPQSLWNQKAIRKMVPFSIASLLIDCDEWKPRSFAAPVGGSWALATATPTDTDSKSRQDQLLHEYYDDIVNALKSVSDFELHLLPADCEWLANEKRLFKPQCLVTRVGTHRLLLTMVTRTAHGALVSTFCAKQPQTEWEYDQSFDPASWSDRDAVCFRGHCEFCKEEGYEEASSVPNLARADAGDTEKAGQETVSTWFAVLLDYLVHRVYTAAVRRRLETHDATTGVSAKDMEKALTGCLQFRADVAFERMAVDKVPIDMDKVHHLVGEELNGRGFNTREDRCQVINHYLRRPPTFEGERSEPVTAFYVPETATSTERELVDALAAQRLCPLGPSEQNLFCFVGEPAVPSSRELDTDISAQDLSAFAEHCPSQVERFIDPSLCDPEVSNAAGQYETQLSSWLRSFQHDLDHASPMYASIVLRDQCIQCKGTGMLPRGTSTASEELVPCSVCGGEGYFSSSTKKTTTARNCVLQMHFYLLLPIVATYGGTRAATYTSIDVDPAIRIKTALPVEHKSAMRSMLAAVTSLKSAVLLHLMPVHFTNSETVSLVSSAMEKLHHGSKSRANCFLSRELRLQFVDSTQVRMRVAAELRSTNLLRLKEVQDGTFLLLQQPSIRMYQSDRVLEPDDVDLSDVRDELIPGAYEERELTRVAPPFWCLLETSFEKSSVLVRLFSAVLTASEQHTVLESIDAALTCLSQRANVSVLLTELSETHKCPRLLFDPDPIAAVISSIRKHCSDLLIEEARLEELSSAESVKRSGSSGGAAGRSTIIISGGKRKSAQRSNSAKDLGSEPAEPSVAPPTGLIDLKQTSATSADSEKRGSVADEFAPATRLKALREKLKELNQHRDRSDRLPELDPKRDAKRDSKRDPKQEREKELDALQTRLELERPGALYEIAAAAGLQLPEMVDEVDARVSDSNFGAGPPVNGRWQVDLDPVEGRYRFPLLHTIELRVNERVHPKEAMEALEQELGDLKISNRSAFVYEKDGHVLYLRLKECHRDGSEDTSIILAVYGIDTPSPEVRRTLELRLQQRLEKMALTALSGRLRKNLRFKVTDTDLYFVCGAVDSEGVQCLQRASSAASFSLPLPVGEPKMLLAFVKQNLEQTKLVHELHFVGHKFSSRNFDMSSPTRSQQGSASPQSSRAPSPVADATESQTTDSRETQLEHPLELLLPAEQSRDGQDIELYYNYKKEVNVSTRVTPAQKALEQTGRRYGEGVAFMFMSVVPKDSGFCRDISGLPFDAPEPVWPPEDSGATQLPLRIVVRLWAKGAVKAEQLMNYVKVGVHQALHEYCLDVVCIRALRLEASRRIDLSFVNTAFTRSLHKEVPSVRYVEVDVALPWTGTIARWCAYPFVQEILKMVSDLHCDATTVCLEGGSGRFLAHSDLTSDAFHEAVRQLPSERALVVLGVNKIEGSGGASLRPGRDTFYPPVTADFSRGDTLLRGDSFCLVVCRGRVWAHTYNWAQSRIEALHKAMSRLAYWMTHRCSLLGLVLAAKMGLEPVRGASESVRTPTTLKSRSGNSWEQRKRIYSVEIAHTAVDTAGGAAFVPRARAKRTDWTGESQESRISTATEARLGPRSVSDHADQGRWLAQMLDAAASAQNGAQAPQVIWPWERLVVPPLLRLSLKHTLPPSTERAAAAEEMPKSTTSTGTFDRWGGLPPLRILPVEGTNRRVVPVQPRAGSSALPTFSQIDWFHGPSLRRQKSLDMLSSADHLQFDSACTDYFDESLPLLTDEEAEPSRLGAAAGAGKPPAARSPTKANSRATELELDKLEPFTTSPPATFGKLPVSPNRLVGGRGRQRSPSSVDWKAPQVRMRAQSEGERRDADEAADSGAAQSFDAAQLWLLLGDHNMQRHQVKNAAARSGAFCPPERQNAAGQGVCAATDLLQSNGMDLVSAAASARAEMQRHLQQAQVLRTIQLDAYLTGPAQTAQNPAVSSSVNPDQLEFMLANSSRLLHACRWPLLFNEASSLLGLSSVSWEDWCRRDSDVDGSDTGLSSDEVCVVRNYRRLLESLLHFYTVYLRTMLDFQLVVAVPGGATSSPHGSGKRASVKVGEREIRLPDSPRVYLRKLVRDGDGEAVAIVMQLEFDGIFVCANLYAPLPWPPKPAHLYSEDTAGGSSGYLRRDLRRPAHSTVDDGAMDVVRRMCFQPFLYDFHLYQACRSLLLLPPFQHEDQSPFAVLPMLRMLTQHHTATSLGSAPAGALGNLAHTRGTRLQLPLPLLGERAALPDLIEFLCAPQVGLGLRCLHHPHERGLGLCVLARKPCTAWAVDSSAETARGVELDGEDLDVHFCVVELTLVSAGKLATGFEEAGDVGATVALELFCGKACDLEWYYPQVGGLTPRGAQSRHAAQVSAAALAFVSEALLTGARQYHRRLLWDKLATGRAPAAEAEAEVNFSALGSPRRSLLDVKSETFQGWAALCSSEPLTTYDARLGLLLRHETVPWGRFLAHLQRDGCDLGVAPAPGKCSVVVGRPDTPMHAVLVELSAVGLDAAPPRRPQPWLTGSAAQPAQGGGEGLTSAATQVASEQQASRVLTAAAAASHLLSLSLSPTTTLSCDSIRLLVRAETATASRRYPLAASSSLRVRCLQALRSLSAGGGGAEGAKPVVEAFANALIDFLLGDMQREAR